MQRLSNPKARLATALALVAMILPATACLPTTELEREIELVTTPGTFSASISGAVVSDVSGSAAFEDSPGSLLCPGVELSSAAADLAIDFRAGGRYELPDCELPVGEIPYGALAFESALSPLVQVPASGDPLLAEYYGVRDGVLEILESTPTKLLGRFDFEAARPDGATIKAIRVRGSFWAVP